MTKPILIIDPGHGGRDPGAVAFGQLEKDFTLEMSIYQYRRFQELKVPVVLTRDKDMELDATTRASIVKNSGAQYCISNHINAGGGTGVETIHSIYSDGSLARKIAEAIAQTGMPFRRVYTRQGTGNTDYYYMHRLTGSVETVIVEYGFLDNPKDLERMNTAEKRGVLAEAAVRAFCEYINHPYQPPTVPADETTAKWKLEGINYLRSQGLLNNPEWWIEKIDEPMPVWATMLLLQRIHEQLKKP